MQDFRVSDWCAGLRCVFGEAEVRGRGGRVLFFLLQGSVIVSAVDFRAAVVAVVQDNIFISVPVPQDAVCFGFGCCGDGYGPGEGFFDEVGVGVGVG